MNWRTLSIALLTASLLSAQQENVPSFPRPAYFRQIMQPADTRVELQNPVRLADFVASGKLELSLRSYLDAVLANNTDVAISKVTVETSRNAITRGFGIFDPLFNLQLNSTRTSSPASSTLAGATVLTQLNQPLTLTYSQVLPTGLTVQATGLAQKQSTNSSFQIYNPAFNSNMAVQIAQPLLRGRGSYYTKLPITIARSRLRAAGFDLQDTVIRLLTTAENVYWDVVSARENLRVQEEALGLADQALKRAKRELELGAISPLDIYQPEQQYATAEINLAQSRFQLQRTEDLLRRQMGADLDPQIRTLPIVLTEPVEAPLDAKLYDREETVLKALRLRPDLSSARQSLDVDDLAIKFNKNQLLPNLSLTGQYGTFGQGGQFFDRQTITNPDGSKNSFVNVTPGGFSDSLGQLFGFGYPTYGFGLRLQFPIRDHANLANLADARTQKKLDALRVRNTEQTIRQDILTSITNLESSRVGVQLARVALDYAQKRVDAEQKKYDLGTSTIFFLLSAQNDLTFARLNVVTNAIQYRRNVLQVLSRTGELIGERGLVVQ